MSAVRPIDGATAHSARRPKSSSIGLAHVLAAPGAIALVTLFIAPTLAVLVIALTDWRLGAGTLAFVGFENFQHLIEDPGLAASLINTGIYTVMVVPATVALGLGVAVLIESRPRFRAFYRVAHFLPVMATMAAMAIAWEAMLHPIVGLIAYVLESLGMPATNVLRTRATVLPALAIIGIWQNLGYAMVLFLAGLKVIPQDLYDAAAVDGADAGIDRLRTVTLPMLGPTLMLVTIVLSVRALTVFDTVSILTQGGPQNASTVLMYSLYVESFVYLHTGRAAAIAVLLLLLVTTLTLIQARIMDRRVHYT